MDPTTLPLRDLHLADPPGWWPLAPGWWAVIALLFLIAAWQGFRAWKRWRHNRARRFALRELKSLEAAYLEHRNAVELSKGVSGLLRRAMLAYAPRDEVAGLTGEAWLKRLDDGLPVPYFHTDGGKSLLALPYRDPAADHSDVDVNAMLAAARMRLTTPIEVAR